ncbi:MAG: hypothetical protein MI866_12925, partial [Bacteroidales bacterium]|nr:hypothetical protein [Bacteroidales bacterium]
MVREKFLQTLNETIDVNPRFSFTDFTIEQKKTTSDRLSTIVRIQYNYEDKYCMVINIPDSRVKFKNRFDETELDYRITCEISPGELELIEKTDVRGISG